MFNDLDDFIDFLRFFALPVIIGAAVIVVLVGLCGFVKPRMAYPTARAQFEELRRSAILVDPTENEDVMGQVVAANRALAERKTCLNIWWCSWTEAPGWSTCKKIAIPKREHAKEKP